MLKRLFAEDRNEVLVIAADQNQQLRSLYVIDRHRFPEWHGEEVRGIKEDGDSIIYEPDIQKGFANRPKPLHKRLARAFKRK